MTIIEKLKICKNCDLHFFSSENGINCALTQTKPTFDSSCSDFKMSSSAKAKQNGQSYLSEKAKENTHATLLDRGMAKLIDEVILFALGYGLWSIITILTSLALHFRNPGQKTNVDILLTFSLFLTTRILYYTLSEGGKKKATFGKRIAGIIVTGNDYYQLSTFRATIRTLFKEISTLLFPLYFVIFLSDRKKAIHDWVSGSIVIEKPV